ncbi:MAG: 6,7-dimethyl-8-ribityllumazine synthase [Bacteriovoracaceae bacterium]|nr:6,7-dimethyl-8-ribityllumazine synthase [Bacteriovoracaceae bacterium]
MILILQSLWNSSITEKLVEGAIRVLNQKELAHRVIQVPGALEFPLALTWAHKELPLKGAIACGAVIKGETHHFEIVANESARALTDLSVNLKIPIGNAILAVYHLDQALERIGGKHGHKGEEAAEAVVLMLDLEKQLKEKKI